MQVSLEIKLNDLSRKKILLTDSGAFLVGREAAKAPFAVPEDKRMSGVHFMVECGPRGCRVIDQNSRNGTFLNGNRIQEAILASGDELRAGDTVFLVKILPDDQLPDDRLRPLEAPVATPPQSAPAAESARPSTGSGVDGPAKSRGASATHPCSTADSPEPRSPWQAGEAGRPRMPTLSVMGWSFFHTPEHWEVRDGLGLQRTVKDEFPSSVAASKELLGGMSLKEFVDAQTGMLRKYLSEARIEAIEPPRIGAAEQTLAVDVRHSTKDGKEMVFRRIYAKNGSAVGVLNVTSLAADLPQIMESLNPLFAEAAFLGAG